jgi:hypothetical protein
MMSVIENCRVLIGSGNFRHFFGVMLMYVTCAILVRFNFFHLD